MTAQDSNAPEVVARLAAAISDAIGRPIRDTENFFEAGLDSSRLVELHTQVTVGMVKPFPVTLLFARPNLAALGRHLAGVRTPVPRGRRDRTAANDPRAMAAARRALRSRGLDGRPDDA
jgi:aryl carrier-like protein